MDEVPLTFDVSSTKTVDVKGAKTIMIKTFGNEKTRLITCCRVSQLWYTAERLVSCATVSQHLLSSQPALDTAERLVSCATVTHNLLSSQPALVYSREASQVCYSDS